MIIELQAVNQTVKFKYEDEFKILNFENLVNFADYCIINNINSENLEINSESDSKLNLYEETIKKLVDSLNSDEELKSLLSREEQISEP